MCIIAFQYDEQRKSIIVAANRDEFYARPTAPLHKWQVGNTTIYGGRDLKENGTWMGVNELGHFVAITNYRNPALEQLKPRSRGQIATDFLTAKMEAHTFAEQLQKDKDLYGPFNVLLFDGQSFVHYNNVFDEIINVSTGIHVLCNATLNTPWPKVERLREKFTTAITNELFSEEPLLAILQDQQQAAPHALPSTGVPPELEQALSSIFIQLPEYGTRVSTIVSLLSDYTAITEVTYDKGTFLQKETVRISTD